MTTNKQIKKAQKSIGKQIKGAKKYVAKKTQKPKKRKYNLILLYTLGGIGVFFAFLVILFFYSSTLMDFFDRKINDSR